MSLAEFLNNNEYLDSDLRENPVTRSWAKKLYIHIDRFISPNLERKNDSTCEIACNLIKRIKNSKDSKLSNPIEISKLEPGFSEPEQSDGVLDHLICMDKNKSEVEKPFVIGVLSASGRVKNAFYICDAGGRALCHMVQPEPCYPGSVVLIEIWRVRVVDDFEYLPCCIEVLSKPVVLYQKIENVNRTVTAISGISISGFVSNVSSCLRLKGLYYVITIVELNSKIRNVLVTEKNFSHWVLCVMRGTKVTISRLKSCDLLNSEERFKVLMPLSDSEMIIQDHPLSNIPSETPLAKSLFRRFLEIASLQSDDTDRLDDTACPAYYGNISTLLSPELGIFSLDSGAVILHCTYLICEDLGYALCPGASILVTKTHYVLDDRNNSTHLICCARSNVIVIEHSDSVVSTWQPLYVSRNRFIQKYLVNSRFLQNPIRTFYVLELIENLIVLFPFLSAKALMGLPLDNEYFSILPWLLFRDALSNTTDFTTDRLPFVECLKTPHSCLVQRMIEMPKSTFSMTSINDLRERILFKFSNSMNSQDDFYCFNVFDCEDLRSDETSCWRDNLILMGLLSGNVKSGNLQLSDSTGSIDCLLLKSSDSNSYLPCLDDMDCLVRITKFMVIVESLEAQDSPTFVTCSEDISSTSEIFNHEKRSEIICIAFSDSDVDVLHRPTGILVNQHRKLGCSDQIMNHKDLLEPPSKQRASFVIYVLLTNINYMEHSSFNCNGFLINLTDKERNFPQVKLHFRNLVKLRSFLHHGMILKIVSASEISPDSSGVVFISNHHEIKHYDRSNELTEFILQSVKEKLKNSAFARLLKNVYTTSDIRLKPTDSRVCVKGIIKVKKYYMENCSLRLRISLENDLCVYMGKVTGLTFLPGLLPGCSAIFRNIKVTSSHKGNVYGKFDSLSSIVIESIPSTELGKQSNCTGAYTNLFEIEKTELPINSVETLDFDKIQVSLLFDLYLQKCVTDVVKLEVSPRTILKVTIRVTETTKLFNAKCLVDDNTGRILLYFDDSGSFFQFINAPTESEKEFLNLFKTYGSSVLDYDYLLHDSNNLIMNFPNLQHLKEERSFALNYLISLCNKINCSVMPSKVVFARTSGHMELFNEGTVGVGSQGNDQMLSRNLKLCHANCIKVI
ncbi:uncharacterized protein LOC120334038 [Styela clava]